MSTDDQIQNQAAVRERYPQLSQLAMSWFTNDWRRDYRDWPSL